ncbi:DUF3189 family protein [Halanaerobacter jeridensis]|uniref:Uncharacterized protein n=1 Tax=Halanaerobacter jeridensis TaxID=706427 RepID=A0A939BQ82_9FIRM|nr:DUF3189 family protein [Halanaerobacter jeridensis]MBM7556014.1 hypothetical protein [Halanaerobacter jeridensis]
MKIIFYSSRDNKLAKWIAYSYLNYINSEQITKKIEDIFLEDDDLFKNNLCYLGNSSDNCQVIALGCYGQNNIILNLITALNNIYSIQEEVILINIDSIYNSSINLGLKAIDFKLQGLGFLLLKKGIIAERSKINKLVEEIKERIEID